jgi:transcriptional regulator with XRE-family HTH domain
LDRRLKQRYSPRHEKMRALLKECRLKAGLTQQELCKRLKRERTFVSTVEIGTRMLDVLEFIDYAEALGADPKKLLGKLTK